MKTIAQHGLITTVQRRMERIKVTTRGRPNFQFEWKKEDDDDVVMVVVVVVTTLLLVPAVPKVWEEKGRRRHHRDTWGDDFGSRSLLVFLQQLEDVGQKYFVIIGIRRKGLL
jgi:hypothetical protein